MVDSIASSGECSATWSLSCASGCKLIVVRKDASRSQRRIAFVSRMKLLALLHTKGTFLQGFKLGYIVLQ